MWLYIISKLIVQELVLLCDPQIDDQKNLIAVAITAGDNAWLLKVYYPYPIYAMANFSNSLALIPQSARILLVFQD